MKIEYIGDKPSKTDNVAGSGVVWAGRGDVQEVPDGLADKLLVHTGVWRAAMAKEVKTAPLALSQATAPVPAPPSAPVDSAALTLAPGTAVSAPAAPAAPAPSPAPAAAKKAVPAKKAAAKKAKK